MIMISSVFIIKLETYLGLLFSINKHLLVCTAVAFNIQTVFYRNVSMYIDIFSPEINSLKYLLL